jgi:hypothetical protein
MPSSTMVPVGVVFLIGGDDGASLAPLFPKETLDLGEVTIDGGACGRHSPCRRSYGGLLDLMMATYASSPTWGHHLWRFICWMDVWKARWLGIGLRVESEVERHVIYHLQ